MFIANADGKLKRFTDKQALVKRIHWKMAVSIKKR
jgi:hypothetical protein